MEARCRRCQRMTLLVAAQGRYDEKGVDTEKIIRICLACKHHEVETHSVAHDCDEALRDGLVELIKRSKGVQLAELVTGIAKIGLEDYVRSQLQEIATHPEAPLELGPSDQKLAARPTAAAPDTERFACPKCERDSIALIAESKKEAETPGRRGLFTYVCFDCGIWWRSARRHPDIPVTSSRGMRFGRRPRRRRGRRSVWHALGFEGED